MKKLAVIIFVLSSFWANGQTGTWKIERDGGYFKITHPTGLPKAYENVKPVKYSNTQVGLVMDGIESKMLLANVKDATDTVYPDFDALFTDCAAIRLAINGGSGGGGGTGGGDASAANQLLQTSALNNIRANVDSVDTSLKNGVTAKFGTTSDSVTEYVATATITTTNCIRILVENVGVDLTTITYDGKSLNLDAGGQREFASEFNLVSHKYSPIAALVVNGTATAKIVVTRKFIQ